MIAKRLALATSIILLTAISGQAYARTANPGDKYWTNAAYASSEVRHPENAFGSALQCRHKQPKAMCTAITADRSRTIEPQRLEKVLID
jgi:hypothetical protein